MSSCPEDGAQLSLDAGQRPAGVASSGIDRTSELKVIDDGDDRVVEAAKSAVSVSLDVRGQDSALVQQSGGFLARSTHVNGGITGGFSLGEGFTMTSIRRVGIGLLSSVGLLLTGVAAAPVANAQERTTFVTRLSAENEIPGCPAGVESGANGVAVIQIDGVTGEISYRVVATNLPTTIAGSPGGHIHFGTAEQTGPIVLPFVLTGRNTGLVAAGTDTNPTLAEAILADPENYYVNVHTTACPSGTVRGQLG